MSDTRPASLAKALALVAAGAVGATALTGVAFAAASAPSVSGNVSPAAAATTPPPGYGPGMGAGMGPGKGPGPGGMMRGGGFGLRGLAGQPLHGEVVVKKADGATVTMRFQQGTLDSVDGSTLKVTSEDQYSASWTVGSATTIRRDGATVKVGALVKGDHVMVAAEVGGGTTTVTHVMAFSPDRWKTMQERRAQMQQRWKERGAPSPTTTS